MIPAGTTAHAASPATDVARRPRSRRARGALIAAIVGVAVVGVSAALVRGAHAPPAVDRATVVIDTVKRGPMLREVQGVGTLVPEQIRWLTAITAARVSEVRARSGAVVEPATAVVVLENPDLVLQSLEADRQQTAAESELVNLEAHLHSDHLAQEAAVVGLNAEATENARRADADDELAKRGFLSKLEMAQSRGRAEALDGRVKLENKRLGALDQQAGAQIASQRAQIERLRSIAAFRRKQLEDLQIRAGVVGVLQDVPVQVGQWVTPGTLLAKVAQPERLKAELKVAETQAKDVFLGLPVTVDTRMGIVQGKVTRIDGAVQGGTVKIDVGFEGPLPKGARPDMSVDGRVQIERLESVLFVGRPPVAIGQGPLSLFKVIEADAVRVPVQLGRASVKTVEVVSGLAEGDAVILSDTSAFSGVDRIRLK